MKRSAVLLFFASVMLGFQMHPPLFQEPVIPAKRESVKDFGAKGDTRVAHDGAIQSGSNVLTSASLAFSSADLNKPVYIVGAGTNCSQAREAPGCIASSGPLDTRITSITDSSHAVLADAAAMDVNDASVTVGTDDSRSIQNAIDGVGRRGGGIVYFPAGVYRLAHGLTVEYSNVRLTGAGATSVLFESNLIPYRSQESGGGHLEGGWAPIRAITVGKMHETVSHIEIDNLQVKSNGDQLVFGSLGQSLIQTGPNPSFKVTNFWLHHVTLTSSNYGLYSNGGMLDNFSIDHNVITEVPKNGIYLADGPTNGIVSDNQISTNIHPAGANYGIGLKGGNNLKIANNTISGNLFACIAGVEFPETDVLVTHNRCLLGDAPNVADGIVFDHGKNIVISDNEVQGYGSFGITFRGWDADISNVEIRRNKIHRGKRGAAISIVSTPAHKDNGPSNVTVTDNTLLENASGVEALDIKGHNVIANNTITASDHKNANALTIRTHPTGDLDCRSNKISNYRAPDAACK